MIELFAGIGIIGVMLTLFKVNYDRINDQEKRIGDNCENWHAVDKKLDLLITMLDIKFPDVMKKARKKNGDSIT